MEPLSLIEWGVLAQVIFTIVTSVGIITSIYLSIKALREVQMDRRQRQRPHLLFEHGGYRYPIGFTEIGKRLPGFEPKFAEKIFASFPEDAESIDIKQKWDKNRELEPKDLILIGKLKNYGLGPALSTEVTFVPNEIWIGSESFTLDQKKMEEPLYHRGLNTMPSSPSHINPGQEVGLPRLPTFIVKDFEKKISRVDGTLEIKCSDVFGQQHIAKQKYHLFTHYTDRQPTIHITFADPISN